MDSWETEASCYVCKSKIYLAVGIADSPVINALEKFQIGCTKSYTSLKLGGGHIIQDNLVRMAFCQSIEDDLGILARLVLHALSCMTTPRQNEGPKASQEAGDYACLLCSLSW